MSTAERDTYNFYLRSEIFKIITKWITEHNITSILDLGCGVGLYFPTYNTLGCKVTALDYSDERIKIAKKMIKDFRYKNITVKNADVLKLLPEEYYYHDVVVLSYFLQHLKIDDIKILINKIRSIADHFIVVGFYTEPFEVIVEKHRERCRKLNTPFNTFAPEITLNSAIYNYPELFNMKYELHQINFNTSVLIFSKEE